MNRKERQQAARLATFAFMVLMAAVVTAGFYAPCGCYAGTAVKDVPLRCVETGR